MDLTRSSLSSNIAIGSAGYCIGTPNGVGGTPAFGGGICNLAPASLNATNCTIALNRTIGGPPCFVGVPAGGAFGGGVYNDTGMFTLSHSTIVGNSVTNSPDFVQGGTSLGANLMNTNGTLVLRASLIAAPGTNANAWGPIIDGGYNIISDGSANFTSGTSFNFTDPRLLPFANNGGPTFTMALAPDSPAIDWVPVANAPATDQRGVFRPIGAAADVGAFEVGAAAPWLSIRRVAGTVELSFPVSTGVPYRIEYSTTLPVWQLYESLGVIPTNGTIIRTITPSAAAESFRAVSY